jgi:hypothetical protein
MTELFHLKSKYALLQVVRKRATGQEELASIKKKMALIEGKLAKYPDGGGKKFIVMTPAAWVALKRGDPDWKQKLDLEESSESSTTRKSARVVRPITRFRPY